jgi:transcriptional regulator with XRE-family HTH domain
MQWLAEIGKRGEEILADPDRFFGENVRQLRQLHGWSQRELAEQLERQTAVSVDPSAITRIEKGRAVSLRQAVALAVTLGAESLDEMLDERPESDLAEWREELAGAVQHHEEQLAELAQRREILASALASTREQLAKIEELVSERGEEGAEEVWRSHKIDAFRRVRAREQERDRG